MLGTRNYQINVTKYDITNHPFLNVARTKQPCVKTISKGGEFCAHCDIALPKGGNL